MMIPGMQGGLQGMMMPQMGQMGMMNMGGGNPMALMNPNGQPNSGNNPNPMGAMMGVPGMGNFPMNFMMQGQPQNQNDPKNNDKNNVNKLNPEPPKKIDSAKKDEKAENVTTSAQGNNAPKLPNSNSNSLPSFLTPATMPFPPPVGQNKDDKQPNGSIAQKSA